MSTGHGKKLLEFSIWWQKLPNLCQFGDFCPIYWFHLSIITLFNHTYKVNQPYCGLKKNIFFFKQIIFVSDDYDDNDLDNVQHPEDHVKVIPNITDSDFIFEDGKNHQDKKDKKEDEAYDDLMYEYYNDLKYGDDDYDEDQYEEDLRQVEQDLKEIVTVTKFEVDSDLDTKSLFHPSYIFLMLSSALIRYVARISKHT